MLFYFASAIVVVLALLGFLEADVITLLFDIYRRKFDKNSYRGKTCWIIGASSGIGEYLAYEFVESGIGRLIISSRRVEELERVKQNCLKINSKCQIILARLDLFDLIKNEENNENITAQFIKSTLKKLRNNNNNNKSNSNSNRNSNSSSDTDSDMDNNDDLSGIETIDYLVLNSGIVQFSMGLDTSYNVTKKVSDINTLSIILFSKVFLNLLCEYAGHNRSNHLQIAVTASLAAIMPTPGSTSYGMTKFAILGYFNALSIELKGNNINNVDICVVCPGPIQITKQACGGYNNESEKYLTTNDDNNDNGSLTASIGSSNKLFDRRIFETKIPHMSLTRHSQLYLSAMYAAKWGFVEAWIAPSYTMILAYFHQYFPFLYIIISRLIAKYYVQNIKDINKRSFYKH